MGKFFIFFELSAHDMSVFLFVDDYLSKYQWIFMKLGVCIDIVEVWFGIDNGKISSIFQLFAHDTAVFSIQDNNLSESN